MTLGQKAFSTKIYIGDQLSPESFVKIDEVFSIGPVGGTKENVDFTNHDSVGYYEYQIFDLKDGNEIKVQANDIPGNTSQELVRTADANSTKNYWKVAYRDGTTEVFQGVIMSLETDASDLKGRVVLNFTIKIAGAITRTNAA